MRIILNLATIIIIITSCKKEDPYDGPQFSHGNDSLVPCSCCAYSDIYAGTYEGHITETEYVGFWMGSPQFNTVYDTTILFSISKIWIDQNCIEDSLICKFIIPEFFNVPISITKNTGYFAPQTYNYQKFDTDSTLALANYTYLSQYDFSYASFKMEAIKQ